MSVDTFEFGIEPWIWNSFAMANWIWSLTRPHAGLKGLRGLEASPGLNKTRPRGLTIEAFGLNRGLSEALEAYRGLSGLDWRPPGLTHAAPFSKSSREKCARNSRKRCKSVKFHENRLFFSHFQPHFAVIFHFQGTYSQNEKWRENRPLTILLK